MKRLTLNRKRSILASKNGGNVAGTDTRETGVGVGRVGSEGSPAELPGSGPLARLAGLHTEFPGTEGIWTGTITALDMGKRNHQRAS